MTFYVNDPYHEVKRDIAREGVQAVSTGVSLAPFVRTAYSPCAAREPRKASPLAPPATPETAADVAPVFLDPSFVIEYPDN